MFHFEFVSSKQKLSNKYNILLFQGHIFPLCYVIFQAVIIPATNTIEVTCHRLILKDELLKFCLREEDMVTKWWAVLKTLWHRKDISFLFFLVVFAQNIRISLCNSESLNCYWKGHCEKWEFPAVSKPVKAPSFLLLYPPGKHYSVLRNQGKGGRWIQEWRGQQ